MSITKNVSDATIMKCRNVKIGVENIAIVWLGAVFGMI